MIWPKLFADMNGRVPCVPIQWVEPRFGIVELLAKRGA